MKNNGKNSRGSVNARTKRALDLLISAPVFIMTLPIQAATAAAVFASMGRPVLFRQERPGLDGKSFELVKFRSMHEVDASKGRVDDASRLTRVGRFIRSTSLDELPTLVNILKGDMSLVGPRPLRMKYLKRYTSEQARRHLVRPGLTGLAQVSGRNGITWERRFVLDTYYVDNQSLWFDIKILAKTVQVVLAREGVSEEGQATMTEFLGSSGEKIAEAKLQKIGMTSDFLADLRTLLSRVFGRSTNGASHN